MRIVDLQLSLPSVLIALILVALLGKGVDKIILALVVVQWAYYARTVRGSALVERRKEYVEAARSLGLSHTRTMLRHILPNCLAPVIVIATVQTAHAISLEATLSFLGVGLRRPSPRWRAHLQRIPVHALGQVLDQLLPRCRAAADHCRASTSWVTACATC